MKRNDIRCARRGRYELRTSKVRTALVDTLDDCVMSVGRHNGQKFSELMKTEPAYCEEAKRANDVQDKGGWNIESLLWEIPGVCRDIYGVSI